MRKVNIDGGLSTVSPTTRAIVDGEIADFSDWSSNRTFTARRIGDEIVLEGQNPDGFPLRWIFSDVTVSSFHWHDEVSEDEGKTWFLQEEMNVRRT
jgi:hypothetical protein